MRLMIEGFYGWVKIGKSKNRNVRVLDTALTVAATLIVAVSYVLIHG